MATETTQGIPLIDENDGDKAEAVNAALRVLNTLLEALAEQSGADKASLTADNRFQGVQTFARAQVQEVQGFALVLQAQNHNVSSGVAPIIRLGDSQNLDAHAITGFAGGAGAVRKLVWNVSGGTLSFLHENAGSTAENRFRLPSAQIDVPSQGFAEFLYDTYSARWRLISST